ncbi:hypothetical protein ACVI53_003639 [Bradyrhizobium barranii subsp. barranii]
MGAHSFAHRHLQNQQRGALRLDESDAQSDRNRSPAVPDRRAPALVVRRHLVILRRCRLHTPRQRFANTLINRLQSPRQTFANGTRTSLTVITAVGSGTYTTPANVLWIEVEMVGGGGGGGSGTSPGNGGAGGNTTFSTLTANGSAATTGGFNGGVGKDGAKGGNGSGLAPTAGGFGANSPYGGAGVGGAPGAGAGVAAAANSGSGGGGTAGTAGTSGAAGGAGGSGFIQVKEFYGS